MVSGRVKENPLAALCLLKKPVSFMSTEGASVHTHGTRKLIETLIEIERETDDLDDPEALLGVVQIGGGQGNTLIHVSIP